MSAKDYFKSLISLDVESSGIDVYKDKIWSIGVAGRNHGKETFVNYLNNTNPMDFFSHMVERAPEFANEQFSRGSLTPFFDAISSNTASTPYGAALDLTNDLTSSKAVLIQNNNFENSMLAQMLKETGVQKPNMRYMTNMDGFVDDGKFLYTPPAVSDERTRASSLMDRYLRTNDPQVAQQAQTSYMKVAQLYEDEYKNATRKGAFVIDLMDITKATYAQAASLGLMDPKMITVGTSVDFLSRNLLLEGAETHTALDDAQRQIRAFDKLNELRSRMASGTLSGDDYSVIARLAKAQPEEAQRGFYKALKNTFSEIDSQGYTRILGQSPTPQHNNPILVYANTKSGELESHFLSRKNYGKALSTQDWQVAFANTYERYSRMGRIETIGKNYKASDFYKNLESATQNSDRIKFIEQFEKTNGGLKLTNWSARNTFEKIADMTSKQKVLGSLAVVGASLYALNEATKNDSAPPPKKKIQDPNPYHGTGFYNFENQQGHHKL